MDAEKNRVMPAGEWRLARASSAVRRPKLLQPADLLSGLGLGLEAIFRLVARALGRQVEAVADTIAERRMQDRIHGARKLVQREMSRPSAQGRTANSQAPHPRKPSRPPAVARRSKVRMP